MVEPTWLCPRCFGNGGRLIVRGILTDAEIFRDGAEQVGDMEWGNDHSADCSCGWSGKVGACVVEEWPKEKRVEAGLDNTQK